MALVEFALVFPVFMTLVLGMFYGGLAWSRNVTLANAAREGARYGATLDPTALAANGSLSPASTHGLDTWLHQVASAVEQNAEGDMGPGEASRSICVSYVNPGGGTHSAPTTTVDDVTHTLVKTGSTAAYSSTSFGCFNDGLGSERRVQVLVSRSSPIQLLFFKIPVTVDSRSVMRFEATP